MTLNDILHGIYTSKGRLDPVDIEQEARAESHPLHDRLEWDESEAARKYRVEQIATLIRSVHIVREVHTPELRSLRVRGWHAIGDERHYVPLETVLDEPDLLEVVRGQMKRDVFLLQSKYKAHDELFRDVAASALALTA